MTIQDQQPQKIPKFIAEAMAKEALGLAQQEARRAKRQNRFASWANDPVGFGEKFIGDTYTEPIKKVMKSVVDNKVTIAKSCNASGKTHMAARVALWFYMVYPDAQVYTTAAPPVDNLKRLMWGEITSILYSKPRLFYGHKVTSLNVARGERSRSWLTGVAIPTSGTAAQRESKFAGKHAPHLLFIVDEADAVPPEVFKGIESCMSGGHARLLAMLNPRAKTGPVWEMVRSGQANVIRLSASSARSV